MALIQMNFHSQVLDKGTNVNIILPENRDNDKLQVLYLLHGHSGDYSNWVRFSNIEKYVSGKQVMVIMPSAYNVYYTDAKNWVKSFSFLTKELPAIMNKTFNLNVPRERTYIAGLSMGGYGALKALFTYPESYSKAASFSGALDVKSMRKRLSPDRIVLIDTIFGDKIEPENDLFELTKSFSHQADIYISCGTEDFLFQDNQKFVNHLNDLKIKHTYITRPGTHNWEFWDEEVKTAIEFFKI